jgi:hypothetical protein
MGHGLVVVDTVLLLQVAPFFGELATEEVVPSNRALLLEKSLITGRIQSRVDELGTELTEKAFPKVVQKNRIKKGVNGLKERPNQIAVPGALSQRETLQEVIIHLVGSVAGRGQRLPYMESRPCSWSPVGRA